MLTKLSRHSPALGVAALALILAGPLAAQPIRSVDPNQTINSDLGPPPPAGEQSVPPPEAPPPPPPSPPPAFDLTAFFAVNRPCSHNRSPIDRTLGA